MSLLSFYRNFKERKQIPVLFMAMAGTLAVLFGFAFLLKYFIVDYLEEITTNVVLTLSLGFLCSSGLFIWGYLLSDKERYKDFTSALVNLSLLLNYMLAYFTSLVSIQTHSLSFEILAGALILINTLLAILITLRNKDRIAALICVFGGSISPLFFQPLASGEPFYFLYLFLLSATWLYISHILEWDFVEVAGFALSSVIMEYYVLDSSNPYFFKSIYVAIFHCFAYQYIYFNLMQLSQRKENVASVSLQLKHSLKPQNIIVTILSLGLLVFNLFFYYAPRFNYSELGSAYLLNALPFVFGFVYYHKKEMRELQLFMLALIAGLLVFDVAIYMPSSVMGIFWAIEALLFIYLGYVFAIPVVRKYGYIFFLLTLVKMCSTFPEIYKKWYDTLFCAGYYNLLMVGVFLVVLLYLSNKYQDQNVKYEHKLQNTFYNALSFWLMSVFLLSIVYYSNQWVTEIAILPTAYLFYIAHRKKLKFSRVLAWAMFSLLVINSGYWAAKTIPMTWKNPDFFQLHNFWYFFMLGILFLGLRLWLKYEYWTRCQESGAKLSDEVRKSSLMASLTNILFVWCAGLFFLVVGHFSTAILLYVGVIPAFMLLYFGYSRELNGIRFLGFFLFGLLVFLSLKSAIQTLPLTWKTELFTLGYYNLLWAAGLMLLMRGAYYFFVPLFNVPIPAIRKQITVMIVSELFFAILFSIWLITSFYFYKNTTYNLAVIPMLIWLFAGHHGKLAITEFVGILCYVFMVFGFLLHYDFDKSVFAQVTSMQVLVLELYLLLWFLKYYFKLFLPNNPNYRIVKILNQFFFFLLPLVIVVLASKRIGEFMPFVLWGTVLVSFLISDFTDNPLILYQFYIWLVAASGYSLLNYNYYVLLAGFLLSVVLVVFKKGIFYRITGKPRYKYLVGYTYYFLALMLFFTYTKFDEGAYSTGLLLSAIYLLGLVFVKRRIYAIRISYLLAFRAAYLAIIAALYYLFISRSIIHSTTYVHDVNKLEQLLLLLGLSGLTILLYKRTTLYDTDEKFIWRLDMYVLHLTYLATYVFFLSMLSPDYRRSVLTLVMFAHSIVLLFYNVRPRFRYLSRLAYVLFVVAMFKLVVYDFENMEVAKRIFILITLGIMFLGSSFLFVRWKERVEKQKEAKKLQ